MVNLGVDIGPDDYLLVLDVTEVDYSLVIHDPDCVRSIPRDAVSYFGREIEGSGEFARPGTFLEVVDARLHPRINILVSSPYNNNPTLTHPTPGSQARANQGN